VTASAGCLFFRGDALVVISRMPSSNSGRPLEDQTRVAFEYLSEIDPPFPGVADAVIGFGMFDLSLAVFCGSLFAQRRARRIIFTGGMGAGTADLGRPEAEAWRDALLEKYPCMPAEKLIVENQSTNTAENIAFTRTLLARDFPGLAFGSGLQTALIVASPSRLRRVALTLRHLEPGLEIIRCTPPTTLDRERSIYEAKQIDYVAHLAGELDRIVDYPSRGWIAAEQLPLHVATAHACLKRYSRRP
jgi:uncharacterized SAM-binding protein YcdF (DUF218 family)